MSKTIAGAVTLTAAALTLAVTGAAYADSIATLDPQDVGHGVDLRSVEVKHGARNVVVVTTHTNLRRAPSSGSAGTVYLDTHRDDRGPEYVFVGGFFEGTDYQLLHTDGFGRGSWGAPVRGSYEMTVDYATEQVRIRMSRATVGRPTEVRASVHVSGTRTDGTGVDDWLGTPRSFTTWVAGD